MKIGKKLYIGFGLVVLIQIIMGFINFNNFRNISNAIESTTQNYEKKVDACNEIKKNNSACLITVRDLALVMDPTKVVTLQENLKKFNANIDKNVEYLQNTIESDTGKKLFEDFKKVKVKFVKSRDEVISYALQKKNFEAVDILYNDLEPLQNEYEQKIDALLKYQNTIKNQANDKMTALSSSSIIWIIILLIIGIAGSMVVAYYVTKMITGPLNSALDASNRIAAGDFSLNLDSDKTDETGLLLHSFKNMSDTIKNLLNEISSIAEGAINGHLDFRTNPVFFRGEYKKLAEEFNSTLDAIINPLKVTADYVDKISKGEKVDLITEEYKGDFNIIKNDVNALINATNSITQIAINISKGDLDNEIVIRSDDDQLMKAMLTMSESISSLASDINSLSNSAINGDLKAKADANKYAGDFKKIIEGVNNTLTAIVNPMLLAADFIRQISEGQNLQKIETEYAGDFNILKNNINSTVDILYGILSEINVLSSAALEGKLNVRGEVKKFKGGWAEIIGGLNQILDGVVDPLQLAANNIDRISKGDIPELITADLKGDFNVIKENLNICIVAISNLIDDTNNLAQEAINGHVDVRADVSKHQGDYRKIVDGINRTLDTMLEPVKEAVVVLKHMAEGKLNYSMEGDYAGDHAILKDTINVTLDGLNELLSQVSTTVAEVSRGSIQVSDASNTLSQGATEQAASLEEITSTMSEVGSQTRLNASNANQANLLTSEAKEAAEKGNKEMGQLNKAMDEINESSKNISKIIRVIDEIAFQTNLLALNAAVEAARAGRHGKGFAVVAEEVRNLAARSASAAKETSDMIENSIKSVENGGLLAQRTSEALEEIKNGSVKAADIVAEIAALSNEQAQAIAQVNEGLNQIDKVTQTNTATAEESASASEELSSQAANLQLMLERFTLRENIEDKGFYLEASSNSLYGARKKALPEKFSLDDDFDEDDF